MNNWTGNILLTKIKMILFSAPHDFFAPFLKEEIKSKYDVIFRQIDCEEDLFEDESVTFWIPNPGQNFVAAANVLKSFPNLKMISTPSTGSNHIDLGFFEDRGITVKSLLNNRKRLDSIRASSEFTLLLLLSSLRKIDIALNEVSEGRWRQNETAMRGKEIIGKTVGIVGLGRNGGNMRRWLTSMDANVLYYDPYKDGGVDGRLDSLGELFEKSDIIVLTVVLNDSTKNLIGKDLLSKLKKGAHIVNTSRGEIVDEEALYQCLAERVDVSYAADVLRGEVTATQFESKLLTLQNSGRVIITPHIAGASNESQTKATIGAFENICNVSITC